MSNIDVQVEACGPCRKRVRVNTSAERVTPAYDKVVGEFAKAARVPGFRPGRAPSHVVARRYAKGINEETRDRLVPEVYREAIEQESLDAVAVVDVQNVELEPGSGLSFTVTVDVVPQFKLPKYKKITVKREPVEVTDTEVDEAFQHMIDSFSRFEDVSGRPVGKGDLAQIDYSGTCDGRPVGELDQACSGLGDGQDVWMLCGEPELLPGLPAGVEGAEEGETRSVTVHFPEDYHVKAVAGKDAVYEVTVKAIRERVPPELDEAFFKRFDVDSEQALKERIRKDIEERKQEEEQDREKQQISDYLLKKVEFDLPESVVQRETENMARSLVQRLTQQGATREQVESQQDSIMTTASETAGKRVKLSYILDKIAEQEDVDVSENDVSERVAAMSRSYGTTPDRLRSELEKRDGLDGLRGDIRSSKTLDLLLEYAKIKG